MDALDDMLAFLMTDGDVGIYDAANTERNRRELVHERCTRAGFQVVFIESICEDESVVEGNVRETKLRSPDYIGVDPEEAVRDFRRRIAYYESTYEPIADDDRSYVKLIDVGRQVVVNRVEGYLCSRLIYFLMNLHPSQRRIWLTRHGESQFNVEGRIGGDATLTERGSAYARALADFVRGRSRREQDVVVWTSTLRRTVATAETMGLEHVSWRALDELDAGICDGLTYSEIADRMNEEYQARAKNKFRYRYPARRIVRRRDSAAGAADRRARAPTRAAARDRPSGGDPRALRLSDGPGPGGVPAHPGAAAHDHRAQADRLRLRGAARRARAGDVGRAGFILNHEPVTFELNRFLVRAQRPS